MQFAFGFYWERMFLVVCYTTLHPALSVHQSVCWSCPITPVTFSITAPALLHTTRVAVYLALFQILLLWKLRVVRNLTSKWGFTRPSSIYYLEQKYFGKIAIRLFIYQMIRKTSIWSLWFFVCFLWTTATAQIIFICLHKKDEREKKRKKEKRMKEKKKEEKKGKKIK